MYLVVSYSRSQGPIIRRGLSLVQAYRLVERIGRGAVFRADGLGDYSQPVYPRGRGACGNRIDSTASKTQAPAASRQTHLVFCEAEAAVGSMV